MKSCRKKKISYHDIVIKVERTKSLLTGWLKTSMLYLRQQNMKGESPASGSYTSLKTLLSVHHTVSNSNKKKIQKAEWKQTTTRGISVKQLTELKGVAHWGKIKLVVNRAFFSKNRQTIVFVKMKCKLFV